MMGTGFEPKGWCSECHLSEFLSDSGQLLPSVSSSNPYPQHRPMEVTTLPPQHVSFEGL